MSLTDLLATYGYRRYLTYTYQYIHVLYQGTQHSIDVFSGDLYRLCLNCGFKQLMGMEMPFSVLNVRHYPESALLISSYAVSLPSSNHSRKGNAMAVINASRGVRISL